MSTKTALVPVADGSEDIETVMIVDVLRRAGITVTVASVAKSRTVTCARGTRIECDAFFADIAAEEFDLIALPGGMPGAEHLRDTPGLIAMLKNQDARGALFAAICASPGVVLGTLGLIGSRAATAYPGFEHLLPAGSARADRVVRDGNLVTSRGPATALDFALALVESLCGRERAEQVAAGLLATMPEISPPPHL